MKKKYESPSMTEEEVMFSFILRPKPGSGGGDGTDLTKERDDYNNKESDSPIWGEDGKLW